MSPSSSLPVGASAEELAAALHARLAALEPLAIDLIDESALHAGHAGAREGGRHYRLRIVSPHFSGLSTLARHRLVYAALGELMHGRVHALAIQSLAPEDAA